MANEKLVDRILQRVEGCQDLAKIAGIEDTAPAEGVVTEHAKNPAAAEIGVVSDLHENVHENEKHDLPGAASDIVESKPDDGSQQGLDATVVPTNEDINAEDILNAVQKTASAVRSLAVRIGALSDAELDQAFSKQASAEDAFASLDDMTKTMLIEEYIAKQADAGDAACQSLIDYATSFNLGMMKRANDQAALEAAGVDPEAADAALQAAAEEDPYGVLMDENGELDDSIDPADLPEDALAGGDDEAAAMAIAQEMSAQIEQEAAQLTEAIAEDIMAEDPSISEDAARETAEEMVADAIDTSVAQQALGAQDEEGNYAINDEDAAAAVAEMDKTASAYPLRGVLTQHFNNQLGLDPSAFAKRLGY